MQIHIINRMQDAIGNPKGYKSACNLFYINSKLVDLINENPLQCYSEQFGNSLSISSALRKEIKMKNYEFELEMQSFAVKQIVRKISQTYGDRMRKIEDQEHELQEIL